MSLDEEGSARIPVGPLGKEEFSHLDFQKLTNIEAHVAGLFSTPVVLYVVVDPARLEFSSVRAVRPIFPNAVFAPTISFSQDFCLMLVICMPHDWHQKLSVPLEAFLHRVLDFIASTRAKVCAEKGIPTRCAMCSTSIPRDPTYNYVKSATRLFFVIVCAIRCTNDECERFSQAITHAIRGKIFHSVGEVTNTISGAHTRCSVCQRTDRTLFLCADCQTVIYCSSICQRIDAAEHLRVCHHEMRTRRRMCSFCGARKSQMFKCSCESVFYCSEGCQRNDWGLHQLECDFH